MEEEEARKAFPFFESYLRAIQRIKKKADQADAYNAICCYAIYGTEPDLDSMSAAAAIAFELTKPNLDASKRKAKSGKQGGIKRPGEGKQNGSKTEANDKQTARDIGYRIKDEGYRIKDKENECLSSVSDETDCRTDIRRVMESWNALGLAKVSRVANGSDRYKQLKCRLRDYGVDEVLRGIDNVGSADFLMGRTGGNRTFEATFDWFIKPNNFQKVLDGNYANRRRGEQQSSNNPFLDLLEDEYGQD